MLLSTLRIAGYAIAFVILTLLTQVGGVVLLATGAISRLLHVRGWPIRVGLFAGLYLAAAATAAHVAPVFGRVPLSCFSGDRDVQVQSWIYCALNRNYVTPAAKAAVEALANHMAEIYPGTVTLVLDANFPFIDGFPLLPHLSHSDGQKLDVAFFYRDATGHMIPDGTRSPLGYFAFEQPREGEPAPCAGRNDILTLRWDLAPLQPLFANWVLDEARTGAALTWLASQGTAFGVEKIFVEPHLAARLGAGGKSIRFQGCRAARHDDHIHFQVTE